MKRLLILLFHAQIKGDPNMGLEPTRVPLVASARSFGIRKYINMKFAAYIVIISLSVCTFAFSAEEPYTYRVIENEDISYGRTKRMVCRLYLNTQTIPDKNRMKATAEQVWRNGNQRWEEFTVFMIFGQIKDFSAGAYGIAEFSQSGLNEFRINSAPLHMLELDTQQHRVPQTRLMQSTAETESLDPKNLLTGQAFFVSEETPLMPEFEPADPIAAIQQIKQIPKGGAFKILEIINKASSWYRVVAIDQNKIRIGEGWINSTALRGQDLTHYK